MHRPEFDFRTELWAKQEHRSRRGALRQAAWGPMNALNAGNQRWDLAKPFVFSRLAWDSNALRVILHLQL